MGISMKRFKNQSGSVLFSVLVVMAVVTIFAVAIMGATAVTHQTAVIRYEREQASYTAESAIKTLIFRIKKAPAGDELTTLIAGMGDGTTIAGGVNSMGGMGEYRTTISRKKMAGKNHAVLSVTAAYPSFARGQTATRSATLEVPEGSVWDGTFTSTSMNNKDTNILNSNDMTFTGICHFNNRMDSAPLFLGGTSRIFGSLFDKESIELTGAVYLDSAGVIGSEKNIHIRNAHSSVLDGKIYAMGDITIEHMNEINAQAIYCGGDMTINSINKLTGDLYVAGDLRVDYPERLSDCNIHVGGQYIANNVVVSQNTDSVQSIQSEISGVITSSPALTGWDVINEKKDEFSKGNLTLTLGGNSAQSATISNSCTITSYSSSYAGLPSTLTVDATKEDIYIKIPQNCMGGTNDFNLGQGVSLEIIGDNNVFFCLDEGVNWVANWTESNIGVVDEVDYTAATLPPPQLYIISNSESIIDIGGGDNTYYSYIYAPKSIFKSSFIDNVNGKPRLVGSVVAGSYEISLGRFQYIKPTSIPAGIGGGSGSGGGGWKVLKFGNEG